MKYLQQPLTFTCENEWLVAIISRPQQPRSRAVLIAVGGPQYRVGSHRQFALLANHLAEQGTPAMRFDYRGMGDSSGACKSFERVGPDLRAAIDAFFAAVPELQDVVIWGLCDAASAALFYAYQDRRVSGIVLLNPWVRTTQGQAQTYLKHYYLERMFSSGLWRKLRRGEFDFKGSVASLAQNVWRALGAGPGAPINNAGTNAAAPASNRERPLPERMADGLARFNGRVLLILSGNDLTAREFVDVSGASNRWRKLLAAPRVTRHGLADATHTFSRREWRDQVAAWATQWLDAW
jgi:exosortase A-associated hydrolase 1